MAINETQSLIVQKHLKDDHPLLKKYSSGGIGTSFSDPLVFSGTYELVGLFNIEDNPYLPHFEFNVGSAYGIVVRRDSLAEGTMHQNRDGTRVQLKSKDEKGPIEVRFPKVTGLFYLRNLARESQLLTLPQLREEDRARLPIDEEQVYATFSFRASSGSYGQLFAEMAIDHPAAEEVITVYLDAIDKRFADYSTLQQFYRGEDKKGKVLYEEQQSRRYSQERRKLNEALFGELSDILNKAGLKPHQV